MEEWETFVRSLAERYGLQQQQSQSESQEDQEHRWVTSSVKKQHDDDDRYVRDDAGMAPSQDPVLPCVLECSTSSTTEGYNDCQESAAAQGITATFASRTHKIPSQGPAAAVSRLERTTSSPVADVSYNRPASPTSVLAAAHTCSSSDSSAATDVPFNRGQSSDCNLLPVANTLLADAGFPPITKPLSGEQLLGTVVDLAREYVRRESFIQELLEGAERSRRQEEQSNLLLVRQDGELQLWKKKLASSEQRSQAALSAAAKAASRFRRELQSLEATNSNLQQRCSQLEHNCRSKERDARKYQTRLLESIEKEESQRSKDVECYRNLKNKVMRARQARGASGGLDWNLLSRDLKPLQLVGIYEKQKATMAWELGALRSQVTSLCHELQHKENNAAATRQHDITDRCGGKNHSQATTLLEQLCDKLQVGSAAQLAGAVESLLMVNTAVPSLEDFVEQVCDVVLVAGREFLPRPTESPCEVPRILEGWLDVLSAVTRSQSIS